LEKCDILITAHIVKVGIVNIFVIDVVVIECVHCSWWRLYQPISDCFRSG